MAGLQDAKLKQALRWNYENRRRVPSEGIGDAQPSTTTKKATGQNWPVDKTKKVCARRQETKLLKDPVGLLFRLCTATCF